ncbi:hypothetical protein K1T71_005233 [Dendrolimus kikuchii]|uniref:Uncharacterized protein n=1 Tax=Dendrolimus kikuchii TaxID=765133 RepID=A0ACC1D6D5_9NEOP|nr:hypothetical protein K1T71_005233 [Dendrolimus kikuchii]
MLSVQDRFLKQPHVPAFIVDNITPHDVAKSIIDGRQREPFYIFDMDETWRLIKNFKEKLPRVEIFYAVKANDADIMIKLAVAMGLGFDCASPGEISKIIQLNVRPTSIIYAVPAKTPEQMVYARTVGVRHTTFNTSCELKKMKQYWPDAKLLIRIRVDSDCVYKLGEKFGCDYDTEAKPLLDEAAALGLHVKGVAFHVGSACFSEQSYVVALKQSKALFDYEKSAGRHMDILDIGGGFFADSIGSFEKAANLINKYIDELFPDPDIQIVAEPGRYLCETAFTLYCNINSVRQSIQNDKRLNMVYINDGIHGTLRSYEEWHSVQKLEQQDNEVLEDTILWGPSSDLNDRMKQVQLPRCTPNDWLVFKMQGCYSLVFAGRFSGFETALTRPVISTDLWYQIKNCSVFTPFDFVLNPDISAPLPSTLPPLIPQRKDENFENKYKLETLID